MTQVERILAIDDDPANLALTAIYLRQAEYDVSTAPHGQAGLTRASLRPPDLMILDVVMPGLNGYEVCTRLKADERTASIPVLILTSLGELASKIEALEAGASDFLTKPRDQAELLARIRTSLHVKRLHDDLAASNASQRELVGQLTQLVDSNGGAHNCQPGSRAQTGHPGGDKQHARWPRRHRQLRSDPLLESARFDVAGDRLRQAR